MLYDNSVRRKVWLDKGETSRSVAKPSIHARKVLISVWWSGYGIVHWEMLPPGQTITATIYSEQLQKVSEKLPDFMRAAIRNDSVVYLHDNARPHTASIAREKLKSLGWDVLPHPAYSPDLAPSDYWLFFHMSHYLRGKKFESRCEVENALRDFFAQCTVDRLRQGLDKLPEKWQKVVDCHGDYFDD